MNLRFEEFLFVLISRFKFYSIDEVFLCGRYEVYVFLIRCFKNFFLNSYLMGFYVGSIVICNIGYFDYFEYSNSSLLERGKLEEFSIREFNGLSIIVL